MKWERDNVFNGEDLYEDEQDVLALRRMMMKKGGEGETVWYVPVPLSLCHFVWQQLCHFASPSLSHSPPPSQIERRPSWIQREMCDPSYVTCQQLLLKWSHSEAMSWNHEDCKLWFCCEFQSQCFQQSHLFLDIWPFQLLSTPTSNSIVVRSTFRSFQFQLSIHQSVHQSKVAQLCSAVCTAIEWTVCNSVCTAIEWTVNSEQWTVKTVKTVCNSMECLLLWSLLPPPSRISHSRIKPPKQPAP